MNKSVVIFDSKYGFTKRYAQWIAESLSCPVFERKNFHSEDLINYGTILYGGGLYAGKVSGIRLLSKNAGLLQDRHVILFTCGLSDPENEGTVNAIRQSLEGSLPPAFLSRIRFFPLRGGIDYAKLSPLHRAMMAGLRKMLLKKSPGSLSEDDRGILETYGKAVDFVCRENLQPLLSYYFSLES